MLRNSTKNTKDLNQAINTHSHEKIFLIKQQRLI